jgi:hypothetical protein
VFDLCEHVECRNPQNCPICYNEGTTWCPHQKCRRVNAPKERPTSPRLPAPQSPPTSGLPDGGWTPERTASVLKGAFVIGVGVGTWLLMRSSSGRLEHDLSAPEGEEPAIQGYSSWEPES